MQNKPLLLIAGASLLVASAVTLASSNTPSPSTGRLLAQAPSRPSMMAKAPAQKSEACLGDDDQLTTLMAYMQNSGGGGEYPGPMGEPTEQPYQEPAKYSEPSSERGTYEGAPTSKRGGERGSKDMPSQGDRRLMSENRRTTGGEGELRSDSSRNDRNTQEPREQRRGGEQGRQPKQKMGGEGFFCGSLGRMVTDPGECDKADAEKGFKPGDGQGFPPDGMKGGDPSTVKGDPNMMNKGGEGATTGGTGTMPPSGGTMGTPPSGGTMGTPPSGGVTAQATKGGFIDVKKSLPKCSELLAQRMGGDTGGYGMGKSRGYDRGGEPKGTDFGMDESQSEPYNPMDDPEQIKRQLTMDKNMFNRPEFGPQRRSRGAKQPALADKVKTAVTRLSAMCKLSETPQELKDLITNAEEMGSLYANLNKLDDESLLKLDGYMQTYKQWDPICNILGMNEGILKQSDDTIAKAEAAAKKKSRYQVKADVLETFKAVVAEIRKEMDTTRMNLLTLSASEKSSEEGMPFGMPPMMEEMKRLNDALDAISETYGLADPEEECGDVFHDMMVLNNNILKALSSPRSRVKMPQIPKIQCDQWDRPGPEGMGGSDGGGRDGGMGFPR